MENLTNDTPPKKGFWTPPRTVRFPPPSGVSALFFLYKNPRQSRPEALLEGSKNFRESAFSGTFSAPHTFCTPPCHGPRISGTFRNPQPLVYYQKHCRYKWEAHCGTNRRCIAAFPSLQGLEAVSQQVTVLQMGGVLRYK